jgi:hypothetical protein
MTVKPLPSVCFSREDDGRGSPRGKVSSPAPDKKIAPICQAARAATVIFDLSPL